jgi:hypothetical protein
VVVSPLQARLFQGSLLLGPKWVLLLEVPDTSINDGKHLLPVLSLQVKVSPGSLLLAPK